MNAHSATMVSPKGSIIRLRGALEGSQGLCENNDDFASNNLRCDGTLPPWYEHCCGLQASVGGCHSADERDAAACWCLGMSRSGGAGVRERSPSTDDDHQHRL